MKTNTTKIGVLRMQPNALALARSLAFSHRQQIHPQKCYYSLLLLSLLLLLLLLLFSLPFSSIFHVCLFILLVDNSHDCIWCRWYHNYSVIYWQKSARVKELELERETEWVSEWNGIFHLRLINIYNPYSLLFFHSYSLSLSPYPSSSSSPFTFLLHFLVFSHYHFFYSLSSIRYCCYQSTFFRFGWCC